MNADSQRATLVSSPVPHEESDTLDLGRLIAIFWNGRYTILAVLVATCLLGALYLIAATPIYEANGLVQVEQNDKSAGSAMGDLASLFGSPMETQAEIQILRSRMVLQKVVENLKLEIEAKPYYLPLVGAFIARHHSHLDSELSAPLFGLKSYAWGGEAIDVDQFDVPEQFLGKKLELLAGQNGGYELRDPDGVLIGRGQTGTLFTGAGEYDAIALFVRDLRARSGTRFTLTHWRLEDVLKRLDRDLQVAEQGKQSGVIGLTAQGPSANYVANVIRQMEDAYVRQNVERRSAEAQQSLEFLQQQLPEIKARVDAAQAKLNTYQMKQGSVNVTKETELVLQQAVDFETQRLQLVGQRQQALQRFTPRHPTVQALDAQIAGLEAELAAIKKRTESLPETQQEVLSLMRDLEVNTQIYTALLNSSQELQVAKAGTIGNVRIIDYPIVPYKKSKPNSLLIGAICIMLGTVAGMALVLIRQSLFSGVHRPDEIERELGLATYAAIPYTSVQRRLNLSARRRNKAAAAAGNHILAEIEPSNVAIEALRSLRTSLQFALLESSNNVVMFTGPTPGLGKSFVSINLAAVLARSGKKAVVVDCDLRRGYLHKYAGLSASPGISDYVAGNADFQSVMRKTAVEGLTMVSSGTTPPNPAELLLHERFTQFVERLSKEFDFVIIDTPPVLPVTDASIVGRLAGCVLLVLKEGAHPMRVIEESARRLRQSGVQIRGTVFNQVGSTGGGYYGYYSAYGYGYSYKTGYNSEVR